jgi:flavin-dependent dehydrogenase
MNCETYSKLELLMDKKVFIFGCGISGATLARKLASHG